MNTKKKILSTKKLSATQKELLNNFTVDEIELIEIAFNTSIKLTSPIKNAVFTSKNAVKSVFDQFSAAELQFENVYCVGDKTAKFLEEKNVKVTVKANSSEELADEILLNKNIEEVYFFCGNLRRDDLPEILTENNVKVNEIEVYSTNFKPTKIKNIYDGILFFSPSSVKSYLLKNTDTQSIAFCIGNTTASEAINDFENVFVADEPTVENVIKSVNQYFDYE
ncbi:MAG: uroporphyrinogen-III synthase [Bacteroidetes bacterium HGW-Bacteroidetes-3]|jgi:uroporphyrinogen-III synthase|nr:MAG: uroporphyrinogen-III synthase [Bacteroidetes bacterium HGW-Bacteroidetes-3]